MNIDEELFKELLECNWFENCGKDKNIQYLFDVEITHDINVAEEGAKKLSWSNYCLEKREDDIIKIYKISEQARQTWNKFGEEVHKNYIPLLEARIENACKKKGLSQEIYDMARYQIMMILILSAYREIYKSELYYNFLEIYLSGHYPCDLKGTRINGKIIVY